MAAGVPEHEYRTLRYVRGEVATRAGFANQIQGLDNGIWNSWIREAHRKVFLDLKVGDKATKTELTMVVGQQLYDLPETVDYRRISAVWVYYNNWWIEVHHRSVTGAHDSVADTQSYPILWDMQNGQIEFWPQPDDTYTVSFEHFPEERYLRVPADWAVATAYAAGDFVVPTTQVDYPTDWPIYAGGADTVDAFVYRCTVAGTSHATTEPVWPLVAGNTVVDNGATWVCIDNRMQVPSSEVMLHALYRAKLHYRQEDAQASLQEAIQNVLMLHAGENQGRRYVRTVARRDRHGDPYDLIPPKQV